MGASAPVRRKLLTTKNDKFIQKAQIVHDDFYCYSNTVYKHCQEKVEIICPRHGSFLQTPNDHLSRKGCKDCGIERRGISRRIDTPEFVKRSITKHGDLYSYEKSYYSTSLVKITVTCKLHGDFELFPSAHIAGAGCPVCAAEKCKISQTYTELDFTAKANEVHNYKYIYVDCGYTNSKAKVSIICPLHGQFSQNASSHLMGVGCPKCAKYGYNSEREGSFYILSDGTTTKVGITHRKVATRLSKIKKSSGKSLEIISEMFFKDGSIPQKLENACLTYLRSKYQQVSEIFDGSTECFYDVDINDLLAFVTPLSQTESE